MVYLYCSTFLHICVYIFIFNVIYGRNWFFSKLISVVIVILFITNLFLTISLCKNTEVEDFEQEKKLHEYERCDKD